MIKGLRHEPEKYGGDVDSVRNLEKILPDLENKIINGNMLSTVISLALNGSKAMFDEIGASVRNILAEVESHPLTGGDQFVAASCLTALLQQITKQQDRKIVTKLWEVAKKIPGCAVAFPNGITWIPDEFFLKYLPQSADGQTPQEKKLEANIETSRKSWLGSRLNTLGAEVKTLKTSVANWIVNMNVKIPKNQANMQLVDLSERTELIMVGIDLAQGGRNILNSCLTLYAKLDQPMTKSAIASLVEILIQMKVVQEIFHNFTQEIASISLSAQQHTQFLILNMIQQAKKGIVSDKKYSEARLDILSCLLLAEKAMAGPGTLQRQVLSSVSLAMAASGKNGLRDDDMRNMTEQLSRLKLTISIAHEISAACNTEFLFGQKDVLSIMIDTVYATKMAGHLNFTLKGMQDCSRILFSAKHLPEPNGLSLIEKLKDYLENLISSQVVAPLCMEIETELRLTVHKQAGLQLDDRNPFKLTPADLLPFLEIGPVNILGRKISIKQRVEAYLEKTFYNLTTVSLHNWRTYGEMRQQARTRLGLETVDDHLPPQTIEQGLDVLEMMRNIHIFTAGYNYNMNSQVFIEQTSNSKHLNTISIKHIANSIRTHGAGIMNTTVNFTYQFLRKKFAIFSQFLYDEHIKSRLVKDFRFFKENKAALDQNYPFDRQVLSYQNLYQFLFLQSCKIQPRYQKAWPDA